MRGFWPFWGVLIFSFIIAGLATYRDWLPTNHFLGSMSALSAPTSFLKNDTIGVTHPLHGAQLEPVTPVKASDTESIEPAKTQAALFKILRLIRLV